MTCRHLIAWGFAAMILTGASVAAAESPETSPTPPASPRMLEWHRLPDLPDELGVAGPFVGVHNGALLVAGGANFPRPVWDTTKVWRDEVYALTETSGSLAWSNAGRLPVSSGYGATVSTPDGVVCIGGNDATTTFSEVQLMQWNVDSRALSIQKYPSLPQPCAYAQAALIGEVIYLAGGQSGLTLDTANSKLWTLDLSQRQHPDQFHWRARGSTPWPTRAFHVVAAQHNGVEECLYVLSGRRQGVQGVEFLTDVWEFAPSTEQWRRRADIPRSVAAGTGIGWGDDRLLVLGGDDGRLFQRTDELKDQHPGFPRDVYFYLPAQDRWESAGEMPRNQVTTQAVQWGERVVLPTGEIRPRVRTPMVWSVRSPKTAN
ncbi:MAG: hypothetical protein ACK5Q5_05505 [Planctomycetaceae bacterium]